MVSFRVDCRLCAAPAAYPRGLIPEYINGVGGVHEAQYTSHTRFTLHIEFLITLRAERKSVQLSNTIRIQLHTVVPSVVLTFTDTHEASC